MILLSPSEGLQGYVSRTYFRFYVESKTATWVLNIEQYYYIRMTWLDANTAVSWSHTEENLACSVRSITKLLVNNSKTCTRNSRNKVVIHHGWDASPSQGTIPGLIYTQGQFPDANSPTNRWKETREHGGNPHKQQPKLPNQRPAVR